MKNTTFTSVVSSLVQCIIQGLDAVLVIEFNNSSSNMPHGHIVMLAQFCIHRFPPFGSGQLDSSLWITIILLIVRIIRIIHIIRILTSHQPECFVHGS